MFDPNPFNENLPRVIKVCPCGMYYDAHTAPEGCQNCGEKLEYEYEACAPPSEPSEVAA